MEQVPSSHCIQVSITTSRSKYFRSEPPTPSSPRSSSAPRSPTGERDAHQRAGRSAAAQARPEAGESGEAQDAGQASILKRCRADRSSHCSVAAPVLSVAGSAGGRPRPSAAEAPIGAQGLAVFPEGPPDGHGCAEFLSDRRNHYPPMAAFCRSLADILDSRPAPSTSPVLAILGRVAR